VVLHNVLRDHWQGYDAESNPHTVSDCHLLTPHYYYYNNYYYYYYYYTQKLRHKYTSMQTCARRAKNEEITHRNFLAALYAMKA
jgi:hypothetical protein